MGGGGPERERNERGRERGKGRDHCRAKRKRWIFFLDRQFGLRELKLGIFGGRGRGV